MKRPTVLIFAALVALISLQAAALAGSRTVEKIYGANGRRVAVVKQTNFGRTVYGQDGRRIAVVRSR